MADIDTLLGAHYAAVVLSRGSVAQAKAALRQALAEDPAMVQTAMDHLARLEAVDRSLGGNIGGRCVVSAVHLKILREVMP